MKNSDMKKGYKLEVIVKDKSERERPILQTNIQNPHNPHTNRTPRKSRWDSVTFVHMACEGPPRGERSNLVRRTVTKTHAAADPPAAAAAASASSERPNEDVERETGKATDNDNVEWVENRHSEDELERDAVELLKVLKEYGGEDFAAGLRQPDSEGNLPLHVAARAGRKKLIRWLLGPDILPLIDVAAVNRDNESAERMAAKRGHKDCAELIRKTAEADLKKADQRAAENARKLIAEEARKGKDKQSQRKKGRSGSKEKTAEDQGAAQAEQAPGHMPFLSATQRASNQTHVDSSAAPAVGDVDGDSEMVVGDAAREGQTLQAALEPPLGDADGAESSCDFVDVEEGHVNTNGAMLRPDVTPQSQSLRYYDAEGGDRLDDNPALSSAAPPPPAAAGASVSDVSASAAHLFPGGADELIESPTGLDMAGELDVGDDPVGPIEGAMGGGKTVKKKHRSRHTRAGRAEETAGVGGEGVMGGGGSKAEGNTTGARRNVEEHREFVAINDNLAKLRSDAKQLEQGLDADDAERARAKQQVEDVILQLCGTRTDVEQQNRAFDEQTQDTLAAQVKAEEVESDKSAYLAAESEIEYRKRAAERRPCSSSLESQADDGDASQCPASRPLRVDKMEFTMQQKIQKLQDEMLQVEHDLRVVQHERMRFAMLRDTHLDHTGSAQAVGASPAVDEYEGLDGLNLEDRQVLTVGVAVATEVECGGDRSELAHEINKQLGAQRDNLAVREGPLTHPV